MDIPSFTRKLSFTTHPDVFCVAYLFWNRGDTEGWVPKYVIPVESGCTIVIPPNGKASSSVVDEKGVIRSLSDKLSNDTYNELLKLSSKIPEYVTTEWRSITTAIMAKYQERTCGSYLERKDTSILWRYRDTDPEFGSIQAKELFLQLVAALKPFLVQVLGGKDYVEVRPEGVNKGGK